MLFDQLQRCIENVKAEAGSSFDIVLLVGGSSRMFQIEEMLEELLPSCNFYPPFLSIRDEIIAMGCAIKASSEYESGSARKDDASLSNGQQEKDILSPLDDASLPPEVPPTSSLTSDAYEANLLSKKLTNSDSTPRLSDNTILPMKQPDLVFIRREQPNNIVLPPKIEVIPRSGFVSSAENLSDQEKIQRFTTMSDESTKAKEKTNLKLDLDFPEKVELIQKPENNNNANTTNKESYRYILIVGMGHYPPFMKYRIKIYKLLITT
uniref:Uncharacterized protein n=1 Tax=Acrobeloides nanus TaxID=290746 RepID=A0A914CYZ4_9BILA